MPVVNLRRPLRLLRLPTRAGGEAIAARALRNALRAEDVSAGDFESWVALEIASWRDTSTASPALRRVVRAILKAADTDPTRHSLGKRYFEVHDALKANHLMSHEEATAFIEHAFTMADLVRQSSLTAAQISKAMSDIDSRVPFSRQSVATVLRMLGIQPVMTQTMVERLFARERVLQIGSFADAGLTEASTLVASIASDLGFPSDLQQHLRALAPSADANAYIPQIQILHGQCSIAEYFDHSVVDLYEFSPRGKAIRWLVEQYPQNLATAGNPYLNIAKSVAEVNASWVRSKDGGELPGADALFRILDGLAQMGFGARRELAMWLRLWAHRLIALSAMAQAILPETLTRQQLDRLLDRVQTGNTGTYGVLEQRVVDAIASYNHGEPWRRRGLGDSLAATNVSRRKIGDCDFQNPVTFRIQAYESHGGELSDVYIESHLRTLRKVVDVRKEELEGITDLGQWSATVTFVAHEVSVDAIPAAQAISGLTVNVEVLSFAEYITGIQNRDEALPNFNQYVLEPLRSRSTPESVRLTFLQIIAEPEVTTDGATA